MKVYCIYLVIMIFLPKSEETKGAEVKISSTFTDWDPYKAIDGNKKTSVHSLDDAELFPTLNITYKESKIVQQLHLYFYRYDDWCISNLKYCKSTWKRLEGIKVSVGIAEQGDNSLIECGTVPPYKSPEFETEPEPLLQTVKCQQEIVGNWIVLQQTRENEVLQFSEIVFVRGWKKKPPNTIIPFLWDNYPLEIETNLSDSTLTVQKISMKASVDPKSSLLASYANMTIGLTIHVDLVNGLNEVKIENHATSKSGEMQFTMPNDFNDGKLEIWTLYKLNEKLHITFKGVKVWEMDYIKLFDTKFDDEILSQRSMKAWSKRVQDIWFDNKDTATLSYRESGKCFKGYKMTRDSGCVECPKNTYSSYGAMSCTRCPVGTVSPAGSGSESDCTTTGYSIPIQTVLVSDYFSGQNPADDFHKPSNVLDGNTTSFYHAKWNSDDPWINLYFGNKYTISTITYIPRQTHYLNNNEDTIFSIIKENGETEDCGTLTGTNRESKTVEDQTYNISCSNKQGVGVKVWREIKVNGWCPAEISLSYTTPQDKEEKTNLNDFVVTMSSKHEQNQDPYNAIDGNKRTYISSMAESSDKIIDNFPTLNITSKTQKIRIVEGVKLHFYLYDTRCTQNVEICGNKWGRLAGIRIYVGVAEVGDSSLIECGTVPHYTIPELDAEKEPAPLEMIVTCKQELTGNWFVVQQTRKNQVLQFSEIEFLHDWKAVSRDQMIPYLWDNHPISLKTNLTGTEPKKIKITANVDLDSSLLQPYAGISIGLTIDVTRNVVEIENHVTSKTEEMELTNMPSVLEGEVIWFLYRMNRKLRIVCDQVRVWEMDYVQLFDSKYEKDIFSQRSMIAWSKRVTEIMIDNEDTATLAYRKSGICFKGYYMSRDRGCVECPKNTYSEANAMTCKPCPDDKLSPRGSEGESSCQLTGYTIPIQVVHVNDYYPQKNPTTDDNKPSHMLDGLTETFYHAKYNSEDPEINFYFGGRYSISSVTYISRLDHEKSLQQNEGTVFSVLKETGETEECGTLTGTNTVSSDVKDQTYEITCSNKQGIGLRLKQRKGLTSWCPAEVKISYKDDRVCTGLDLDDYKDLTTTTSFPVSRGTQVQVTCKLGYKHPEEATLTCLEGTKFSATHLIKCSIPGTVRK